MKNTQIEKLASNILEHSVNLQEKEEILIEIIGEEGMPLAKEIIKQAEEKKARPYFKIINNEVLKTMLENSTEDQIKLYAKHDWNRMRDMDAYIGIRATSDESESTGIPVEKMEMYNKYYTFPEKDEERMKNTKWCILRYPNKSMAQKSNMNIEEFEDFYFNVCDVDYKKMSKAMDNLVELMNKTDKVRIVGKDTDLTFSIKDVPTEKYFGTYNIPDGEVATAPIRESANGYIKYNIETTYNGIKFSDIKFEFKDGKIVKATANNTEELNKILDTDIGARYIGEFSIGLNPYIEKPIGDVLFDEKIKGSFYLTLGEGIESIDNGNHSNIQWDFVKIQEPEFGGGEIWFDDVLIRKDGRFVVDELECLNPENLK